MLRSLRSAVVAAGAALSLVPGGWAAVWRGGDLTWSEPDADSFETPYRAGDAVVFAGAGCGTVTVAGNVSPGSIALKDGTYTFLVKGDDALGKAPVTVDYAKIAAFAHSLGREVSLANTFFQPNGASFAFAGGDFRLTGTVHGGANFGPNFMPAAGVALTLAQGVSGPGGFSISAAERTTVRILGPSSARLERLQSGGVRIEIGADDALGPAGTETPISGLPPTFVAYGGPRTIASGIFARGFAVAGVHDLILAGPLRNNEGYALVKDGPAALVLAADNRDWGHVVRIREGVVRLDHTNALGLSAVQFEGGVLELAAGDFDRNLSRAPGAGSGTVGWSGGGGFSARGRRRRVNIGGHAARLRWGADGFVPPGQSLVFGSRSADASLQWVNPVDLGGSGRQGMLPPEHAYLFGARSAAAPADLPPPPRRREGEVRTICVHDNPACSLDRVELAGVLSGAADMGLDKTGEGTLFFGAANTYTGDTTVRAGAIGGSGRLAGRLFFNPGSGFVLDAAATEGPLVVAGAIALGDGVALTVLGAPRTEGRLVMLQGLAGISGRFARVAGVPRGWMVDYSAAGEVSLLQNPSGVFAGEKSEHRIQESECE